jgi:hypothetical protein
MKKGQIINYNGRGWVVARGWGRGNGELKIIFQDATEIKHTKQTNKQIKKQIVEGNIKELTDKIQVKESSHQINNI